MRAKTDQPKELPKDSQASNARLRPVLRLREWYWAGELRKVFKMSRETLAEVKRLSPNQVVKTRQGDIVQGIAILKYLKTRNCGKAARA